MSLPSTAANKPVVLPKMIQVSEQILLVRLNKGRGNMPIWKGYGERHFFMDFWPQLLIKPLQPLREKLVKFMQTPTLLHNDILKITQTICSVYHVNMFNTANSYSNLLLIQNNNDCNYSCPCLHREERNGKYFWIC